MSDSTRDDGGPAFPRPTTKDIQGYGEDGAEGMTLRDYFAAAALQAIIAKHRLASVDVDAPDPPEIGGIVSGAYRYADAMLTERSQP